ncbi:uncharacterized protein LOC114881732 [Osmia bicornis bicornis]|uniref:uncharacterized protein LOC114881732 n=1 Tax=Osmia bicornis bicornis TaxID=1437191 RepID=UPI001EAEC6F6|nr:uncharacterized protein LOC114881732 [Osmia bicornis bicornis]
MEAELKKLTSDRGLIKAALTRFSKYFNESERPVNVRALQKRLEANVGLYNGYNAVQSEIERIVAGKESEAAHAADRDDFEETYFNLIADVESYIESVEGRNRVANQAAEQSPTPALTSSDAKVKLPTIQLPSFDGDYSEWIKFKDTFTSLVHESELPDVQKFNYLNSALKGPAARVIQSLGVSDTNYKLAWDSLKSRYENSAMLRKFHVVAILDLPVIQKQSSTALRELLDNVRNHLAALKSLKEPIESWDSLLIPILSRKLDMASLREWEKGITSLERVTFKSFTSFLEERSSYLENIASPVQVPPATRPEPPSGFVANRKPCRVMNHVVGISSSTCPACGAGHPLFRCEKFKGLSIDEKTQVTQTSQSCFNCLQTGHRVKACTRKHCDLCGKKHHILLHRDNVGQKQNNNEPTNSVSASRTTSCVASLSSKAFEHSVLSTAVVHVENDRKERIQYRVLLDSGSQSSFVTHSVCKRLGLRYDPVETEVVGIDRKSRIVRDRVDLKIVSRVNGFNASISCLVIDNITDDMPNVDMNRSTLAVPAHIMLADPEFDRCRPIDLLIGAGLFWYLLCVGQHKAGNHLLWQKTQLGWVLGGQISWPIEGHSRIQRGHLSTNRELSEQLERFWKVEEIVTDHTVDTDECDAYFRATTRQNDDGRYIVKIPFNEQVHRLGSSRQQAENRLKSLERRLMKQPQLREQYIEFLAEYERLGHMSRISKQTVDEKIVFYLPHHAVFKADSTTTKLRVVFDGSAKTSTGKVQNSDTQKVGPTVQSKLVDILLRFRTHRYVLSADIAKMYRQILVDSEQRRFQRILWRSNPDHPIKTFELNTITYGTASAPYLATRVLQEVGLKCVQDFPTVSRIVINDFYVDDLLTGLDTVHELEEVKRDLTDILSKSGFDLRKWASNCATVLEQATDKPLDKDPKTLGLHWSSARDELLFKVTPSAGKRITKRTILSEIAQLFDPLGLVGPIITRAKLLMQHLWQTQVGWDESLSQELCTQWTGYRKELASLNSLRIPRQALVTAKGIELHGFSDASERAYGACIYLRSSCEAGRWEVRLLCSKSRVAPLKIISLPRLELCGALLLAQLVQRVRTALRVSFSKERYWCDSTITLAWIRGNSNRWKTFVANRVTQIQLITDLDNWSHIRSHENPADLISQGVDPNFLISSELWWLGPSWLTDEPDHWPPQSEEVVIDVPEQKQAIALATVTGDTNELFNRYSDYTRLVRVTAYCLRFINNIQLARNRKPNDSANLGNANLTQVETHKAQETLVRLAQKETFSDEINLLVKGQTVSKQSPLRSLAPFIDSAGLVRVGGRLINAPISYNKRHPVLLPSKHALTDLIIRNEHSRLLHAGCQHVIASLRERFWPIAGMRAVKKIIRSCVRCFRVKPQGIEYPMGQLPAARVTPTRPFTTCGVDYAGPFITKDNTRSKVSLKSYICIFVCFATKATHIELAVDLSTDAFINCLKRFIARRGRCHSIVSDNGTNFVGARNKLSELDNLTRSKEYNCQISQFLSREHIEWSFIPPRAPHFGGLWESAVKLTKYHLLRVIGEQRLTYEELYTLLTQVESCLNSRPLSPLSSDPHDLNPLTPGHFLIGTALSSLPDHDLTSIKTNRLNRYQLIQQMYQHFWQRWQKEYLHQLQQNYKWTQTSKHQLTEGILVVIKEDGLQPLRWCLGRVTELHQGKDGVVRVVSVKTMDGLYKRPVSKICILPMPVTEDQECN